MNTKRHAVTGTSGRPIRLCFTARQVRDYTGAAAVMRGLPKAEWLLGSREYEVEWFRETLTDRGTKPCISSRRSSKQTVKYPSRDIALQYIAGQGAGVVINEATVSRECSQGSRLGDASQHAATDHKPPSSLQSLSYQPLPSSFEILYYYMAASAFG